MLMPGRKFSATNGYRYGFNGKENDNDVKGDGIQLDYGFRIYDSRLGKFLSVDPLSTNYPWYTPYQFAGNKPITKVDLDGLEEYDFREIMQNDGSVLVIVTTGKSLLKQQYQKITTESGVMYHFKYKEVQDALSRATFNEITQPGTNTNSLFSLNLPITKDMDVLRGPGQIGAITPKQTDEFKFEPFLTNATSVIFTLKNPEIYKASVYKDGKAGSGSQEFTFNIEMTSGTIKFDYYNSSIPDKYSITDGDGNPLAATSFEDGDHSTTFKFSGLKTPIIKINVISSDSSPENSRWFFKLQATEDDPPAETK